MTISFVFGYQSVFFLIILDFQGIYKNNGFIITQRAKISKDILSVSDNVHDIIREQ